MKMKLVFGLAVLSLAFCAQALGYNWKVLYNWDGGDLGSSVIYVGEGSGGAPIFYHLSYGGANLSVRKPEGFVTTWFAYELHRRGVEPGETKLCLMMYNHYAGDADPIYLTILANGVLGEEPTILQTTSDPNGLSDEEIKEMANPEPVDFREEGRLFTIEELKAGAKLRREEKEKTEMEYRGRWLLRFKQVSEDQFQLRAAVKQG